MRTLVVALLLSLVTSIASASVSVGSLRCGATLVRLGATRASVTAACGTPTEELHRFDAVRGEPNPTIGWTTVDRLPVRGTVEDWIYAASEGQERRTLTFVGGRLAGITLDVR